MFSAALRGGDPSSVLTSVLRLELWRFRHGADALLFGLQDDSLTTREATSHCAAGRVASGLRVKRRGKHFPAPPTIEGMTAAGEGGLAGGPPTVLCALNGELFGTSTLRSG